MGSGGPPLTAKCAVSAVFLSFYADAPIFDNALW